MKRTAFFTAAWLTALLALPAAAQHPGHPTPPAKPAPKPAGKPPASKPADPAPAPQQAPARPVEDHSAHAAQQGGGTEQPKEPIPALTDADRQAAFPRDLDGHAVHDNAVHFMVLFDQLEWQGGADGGPSWENTTWVGGDRTRLWIRTEGESEDGRLENALADVLWGRMVARWWDVVAGVRQDFRPGDPQTWVGAGVQGLAPYWFEVEATAYVGSGGRTHARVEAEYELLVTNRLILQPLVEVEMYGKSDPARGLGKGLSTLETGLRLRYEFHRQFAPYVGVTWERRFFGTADFARAAGEDVGTARVALGLRSWF